MKYIIFAGGAGTRLWPISRSKTPKQFEKLIGEKSTLQLAIERIEVFGLENVYVSTGMQYESIVRSQLPTLDPTHIFTEPARRDVAAAVGLTVFRLYAQGVRGSVALLWSDHFMKHPEVFQDALAKAERIVSTDPARVVFFGEQPRFANQNLGWIRVGEETEVGVHSFVSWKYRPETSECVEMFESKEWLWNPGYFVFDIETLVSLYRTHQPQMVEQLEQMVADESLLQTQYPLLPALSFDNAIVDHITPSQAVVLSVDLGWSDPGTLYALKEALVGTGDENYTHGKTVLRDTHDSMVYSSDPDMLVTTIGLEGLVVIHSGNAILVCPKDRVPEIKELLKDIEAKGEAFYL